MKSPHTPSPVVLLVEDDAGIRRFVRAALESEGCTVHEAAALERGRIELASRRPDLLVLDLGLPDGDGMTLLAELRGWSGMPVLVLSARSDEADKVAALDAGADDYLAKPFGVAELLARVDAALRRRRLHEQEATIFTVGKATVDFRAHKIERDGAPLETTALEMRLLRFFVKNEGALLPRQRILDAVWGADYFGTDRTVDNFINRLRAKIEPDPAAPVHLVTVRGAGYRFSRSGHGP